ncbi:MAG: hypothetical protein V3U92_13680 [Cellulophaga sp.]
MKKIIASLLFICFISFTSAQNCEAISPMKAGMKLEQTHYNKKGKVEFIQNHTITSTENEDGFFIMNLESSKVFTKKSKNTDAVISYALKCKNGNFFIDMNSYIPQQQQGENKNGGLKIEASGDFLLFPSELTEGQSLENGEVTLKIGTSEVSILSSTTKIFNRKVLEGTKLTTKAGSFDGYKMSFDYEFKLGFIKMKGSGIEWYVKGIGIIKSESYNKKGKLLSWWELTKISGQ